MKTNTNLLAFAASTIALFVAAPAAQATDFDPADAIGAGGAPTAPWSAVRISGGASARCRDQSTMAQLTNAYSNGSIAGRHGGLSPDQPIVAENLGAPFSANGITVPSGAVLMHPGPNNECSVLRLTIPTGDRGVYSINARYEGIDANAASNGGDWVTGMVLHNGVQIGSSVDTSQGPGSIYVQQRTLCPGDRIDFAIHMKNGMSFDSTRLTGLVRRVGNASLLACPPRVAEVGTAVGVGTLLGGAELIGDPVTVPEDPMVGPSPCCAPWSELDIGPSLHPTFTDAASPYTMTYQTPSAISAQMSAYLNYIHAMDPSITTLTLTWQAVDVGTSPGMSGTTVGAAQTVTWTWTSGGVNVSGGGFWGSQPFQVGRWYRFMTTLSHNGTPNSPFFGPDCINNSKAFSWGVANRVATMSSTNARGQVVRSAAVQFTPGRPIETGQIRERPRD